MKVYSFKGIIKLLCIIAIIQTPGSADTLHVRRAANTTGSWCWAGAMECVVKFYDTTQISKTQAQIVAHVTTNKAEAPNTNKILAGLKKSMEPVKVTVTESTARPTEAEFKAEADKKEIIYLLQSWKKARGTGYHASVYVGYIGTSHYLMDPWANTNQTTKYKRITFNQILDDSQLQWQRCFKFKSDKTSVAKESLSLLDKEPGFKIILHTNITSGNINLLTPMQTYDEKSLKIYSAQGSCVYKTIIGKNVMSAHIDLSHNSLSSGTYFLAIENQVYSQDRSIDRYSVTKQFTIMK